MIALDSSCIAHESCVVVGTNKVLCLKNKLDLIRSEQLSWCQVCESLTCCATNDILRKCMFFSSKKQKEWILFACIPRQKMCEQQDEIFSRNQAFGLRYWSLFCQIWLLPINTETDLFLKLHPIDFHLKDVSVFISALEQRMIGRMKNYKGTRRGKSDLPTTELCLALSSLRFTRK